ncbi:energy transducer TonB [Variovorax sp. YR216]|uniref:energy transducer TonB n=1 Tax=Variovorax sp. YR216 TaxID=1882828 RepID=UPI0008959EB0|nr:TonB family protein [Variovorax sp. YR216]SEB12151.1 TonB family C-terminal domain-containing protein [Variovorax sp. YR216]
MTGAIAASGGIRRDQGWRESELRRALPLCAAASLVVHLVLINLGMPSEKARPQLANVGSTGALQARLIQSPRIAPPAAETMAFARNSSASARPEGHTAEPPLQRSGERRGLARRSIPDNSAPTEQAPISSHIAAPALPTAEEEEREYVPRPQLSSVPVAQGPVIIGAPSDVSDLDRHTAVLSLFIDEDGQVRRIRAEEPRLPEAFEQAAREAFMAARFSPGQVDGKAVKSRVRVEVVFDNTPLGNLH